MHDVFLSYSHQDKTSAEQIFVALKEQGLTIFMDTDSFVVGTNIAETISNQMEQSKVILLLLSKHSQGKYVERELREALDSEYAVIPVLLDRSAKENWIWPLVADKRSIARFEYDSFQEFSISLYQSIGLKKYSDEKSSQSVLERVIGYDVFICHARSDGAETANRIANRLRKNRYSVFLDIRGIEFAEDIGDRISTALKKSKLLLVLLSSAAWKSSYVADEIRQFGQHRNIIPVLIDAEPDDATRQARHVSSRRGIDALDLSDRNLGDEVVSAVSGQRGWLTNRRRAIAIALGGLFLVLVSLVSLGALAKSQNKLAQIRKWKSIGDSAKNDKQFSIAEIAFGEASKLDASYSAEVQKLREYRFLTPSTTRPKPKDSKCCLLFQSQDKLLEVFRLNESEELLIRWGKKSQTIKIGSDEMPECIACESEDGLQLLVGLEKTVRLFNIGSNISSSGFLKAEYSCFGFVSDKPVVVGFESDTAIVYSFDSEPAKHVAGKVIETLDESLLTETELLAATISNNQIYVAGAIREPDDGLHNPLNVKDDLEIAIFKLDFEGRNPESVASIPLQPRSFSKKWKDVNQPLAGSGKVIGIFDLQVTSDETLFGFQIIQGADLMESKPFSFIIEGTDHLKRLTNKKPNSWAQVSTGLSSGVTVRNGHAEDTFCVDAPKPAIIFQNQGELVSYTKNLSNQIQSRSIGTAFNASSWIPKFESGRFLVGFETSRNKNDFSVWTDDGKVSYPSIVSRSEFVELLSQSQNIVALETDDDLFLYQLIESAENEPQVDQLGITLQEDGTWQIPNFEN